MCHSVGCLAVIAAPVAQRYSCTPQKNQAAAQLAGRGAVVNQSVSHYTLLPTEHMVHIYTSLVIGEA